MTIKDAKRGDMLECKAYEVALAEVGIVRPATRTRCLALTLTVGGQEFTYTMGEEMASCMIRAVAEVLAVLAGEGILEKEGKENGNN